jgi:hypothetical protein
MVCPDGTPWNTAWTPRTESITPAASPAPEPQGADKVEPADTSVIEKGPERAGILALKPCNWEKGTGTESAADSFMGLVLCQGKIRLTGQKQRGVRGWGLQKVPFDTTERNLCPPYPVVRPLRGCLMGPALLAHWTKWVMTTNSRDSPQVKADDWQRVRATKL